MSYIYRAYDKNDREWYYLDSLGNDYFGRSTDQKRVRTSLTLPKESVELVDKYRKPLGLSRSRYILYIINDHFSVVNSEDNE